MGVYRNDLIRSAIVNKDMNKSTFATESKISLPTVQKLWDGDENLELPTIIQAAKFLGIPLVELFDVKEEQTA